MWNPFKKEVKFITTISTPKGVITLSSSNPDVILELFERLSSYQRLTASLRTLDDDMKTLMPMTYNLDMVKNVSANQESN